LIISTSCINRICKVDFRNISLADSTFSGEQDYYCIASSERKIFVPGYRTIEFWSVKKLINPQSPDLGFMCDFYLGDSLYHSINIDLMQLERDMNGSYSKSNNEIIVKHRGRLNGYFISPFDTTYILKAYLFSTANNSLRIKHISLELKLK
jgi:hypothetical protein